MRGVHKGCVIVYITHAHALDTQMGKKIRPKSYKIKCTFIIRAKNGCLNDRVPQT